MDKQELRLALVIYGGASLAVYMHGVTKEFAKLIRASKVLSDTPAAARAGGFAGGSDQRPADTEHVYYEWLRTINATQEFRVVIDVIAGASAGAINGALLTSGLVHDADPDAATPLWLAGADSDNLAAHRVRPWHKWYMYPVVRALLRRLPAHAATAETRRKLARVMRSPWWMPPFSGERLGELLLDALDTMRRSRRPGSSLVPAEQRLDFHASVTDLRGYPRPLRVAAPGRGAPRVEREHAVYCSLSHGADATSGTDLSDDNTAALVWAARASASFAGAFPAFRHAELEGLLRRRGRAWPTEQAFLDHALRLRDGRPMRAQVDPRDREFIDGGIVDNKPFRAVLDTLYRRPADRQVYRRVVYIEPNPALSAPTLGNGRAGVAGYLDTLRTALVSIPRLQPIQDELAALAQLDARARQNQRVLASQRGRIDAWVAELLGTEAGVPLSAPLVTYLRETLDDQAALQSGIAWQGYAERRAWRLVDAISERWLELGEHPFATRLAAVIAETAALDPASPHTGDPRLRLCTFLDRFDVSYRMRQLQFLIRRLNQLEADSGDSPARARLGALKLDVYRHAESLEALRRRESGSDWWRRESGASLTPDGSGDPDRVRDLRSSQPSAVEVRAALDALAARLTLGARDRAFDELLAAHLADPAMTEDIRRGLIAEYAGFPLLDLLLFGDAADEDLPDPLTPVAIERVSPDDAGFLGAHFPGLRSRALFGFLGFFDRSHREHDYLWGRLHGAERLVDILAEVIPRALPDRDAAKRALVLRILDAEEPRLHTLAPLFATLRAALR